MAFQISPWSNRSTASRHAGTPAQMAFRSGGAALNTPEDIQQRQAALRGKFIEALGGLPEKTPLNPRITGSQRRDVYVFFDNDAKIHAPFNAMRLAEILQAR